MLGMQKKRKVSMFSKTEAFLYSYMLFLLRIMSINFCEYMDLCVCMWVYLCVYAVCWWNAVLWLGIYGIPFCQLLLYFYLHHFQNIMYKYWFL